MKVSRELYQEMQNQTAPKTKSYYTIPMAFLIGGFICTLGELLLHLYAFLGADKTAAAAFTSITLIGCSVLFTGLGWYEKIAKHAGAGTLVPITGFANAVSCCAIESRAEGNLRQPITKQGFFSAPLHTVVLYRKGAAPCIHHQNPQ